MTVVYLAGPMSGYTEFNFPEFDHVARHLRDDGYAVISPAELDRADGFDEKGCTGNEALSVELRQRFARNDITAILQADEVVMLPGWRHSTGATNEARIASWLGTPISEWGDGRTVPVEPLEMWSGTA